MKALRLMKMTKMLRLGRLKRIMQERSGHGSLASTAFGIIATLGVIIFLAHMLACFWFFIGENSDTLDNSVVVSGWVERETDWWVQNSTTLLAADGMEECTNLVADGTMDCRVSLSTKYSKSLSSVLNSLENAYTPAEQCKKTHDPHSVLQFEAL